MGATPLLALRIDRCALAFIVCESCALAWTVGEGAGMYAAAFKSRARCPRNLANENLLPAVLHLVERPDLRPPALALALWRAGRPGRVRQPLFPRPRRQDRPDAADGAALGDLPRRGRGVVDPAVVAWLDAPHRRRAADPRALPAAAVAEAAPAEPHRHAGPAPSDPLALWPGPGSEGHRRHQGLGSTQLGAPIVRR